MVTQSEEIVLACCDNIYTRVLTHRPITASEITAALAMAIQVGLTMALHYPEYALTLMNGLAEELTVVGDRYTKDFVQSHPITSSNGSSNGH